MGDNLLVEKSKKFAKEIIFTIKDVRKEHREFALTDQLLRSGAGMLAHICTHMRVTRSQRTILYKICILCII